MERLKPPPAPARAAGDAPLAALDDVARTRVASAAAAALADNTRMTYASQWNRFESWCEERGVDPLDVEPAQVAAYLAERAETRKLSTVQVSAAATAARAAGRADPTKTPLVADTLRGIARQHAAVPEAAPRQAAALDYQTAVELLQVAARPQRRGRRDGAIVALAFCAGLRRSEIAGLVWDDITPTARAGQLRVRVRTSKANAGGRREDLRLLVGPFARAVDRLHAETAAATTDRVVPLSPHQVNRRVQVLAAALGPRGRLVAFRPPRPGVGARPARRLDDRRPACRRLAQPRHGRPLRLGRRRRGRRRRQALRERIKGREGGVAPTSRLRTGRARKRRCRSADVMAMRGRPRRGWMERTSGGMG